MSKYGYVYILSSSFRRLYVGVTCDLARRVFEHKELTHAQSHTARYRIDRLVYFERFASVPAAINREKQLKGWLRVRKLRLIVESNPEWRDLSEGSGEPLEFKSDGKSKSNGDCGGPSLRSG